MHIAKNAHASFMMSNKTNYMTPSTDDSLKGMCITIKGLKENDFPVDNYKDWNGYIVIEEAPNKQYQYTAWVTNGKYVISLDVTNPHLWQGVEDPYLHEVVVSIEYFNGVVCHNRLI